MADCSGHGCCVCWMMLREVNIDSLYETKSRGFSQAVIVEMRPPAMIQSGVGFISGMVAWDTDRRIPQDIDIGEETTLAMQNVVRLLRAESREVQSIVQVRTFVVNLTPELARTVSRALEVFFTETAHRPASTMVGVTGLAAPEVRVEIEV
ncbi:MAG TPA: RidA family protein, partial [Leptospiraceae bacterium]|nr:RidA family protein [Leptospiraceae bacterium]